MPGVAFQRIVMEIIVIRHGKSIVDTTGKVSAHEFGGCVKEYDRQGVCEDHLPPKEVIDRVSECAFTVCSDLKRSIHSAKLLGIDRPNLISPAFRECEMPYTNWQFPKMSKTIWPLVFRIFQMVGYSPNAESYKEASKRSKKCASELKSLASEHGSVLYVGHGALCWLMHKHLIDSGWQGPKKSVRENWEYGVYSLNET